MKKSVEKPKRLVLLYIPVLISSCFSQKRVRKKRLDYQRGLPTIQRYPSEYAKCKKKKLWLLSN